MKPPPIKCTKQSIASFCPVTICSVETGYGEAEVMVIVIVMMMVRSREERWGEERRGKDMDREI